MSLKRGPWDARGAAELRLRERAVLGRVAHSAGMRHGCGCALLVEIKAEQDA